MPNVAGTIAMARTPAVNSATTQWFFNVNDNPALNDVAGSNQYAVFGRVISGMSVVNAIAALPTYNVDGISGLAGNVNAQGGVFTQLPLQNYSMRMSVTMSRPRPPAIWWWSAASPRLARISPFGKIQRIGSMSSASATSRRETCLSLSNI